MIFFLILSFSLSRGYEEIHSITFPSIKVIGIQVHANWVIWEDCVTDNAWEIRSFSIVIQQISFLFFCFEKFLISGFATKKRNEKKIKSIQASLKEEQRRLRELKQLYVKELMGKCELESIIRKSVEDVKEEII